MGSLIEQYEAERRQQQQAPQEPTDDLIAEYEASQRTSEPRPQPERGPSFLNRAIDLLHPVDRTFRRDVEQLGVKQALRGVEKGVDVGVKRSVLTMGEGLARAGSWVGLPTEGLAESARTEREALTEELDTGSSRQAAFASGLATDLAPYVLTPMGVTAATTRLSSAVAQSPKLAKFVPFAERVRRITQPQTLAGKIGYNIAVSAPADVAFAAAGPESSVLGAAAELTGNERLGELAENPAARIGAEIGFGALAATGVEVFLNARRSARAAKAAGVPEAAPVEAAPTGRPADVVGAPIPPEPDDLVPPRPEPESVSSKQNVSRETVREPERKVPETTLSDAPVVEPTPTVRAEDSNVVAAPTRAPESLPASEIPTGAEVVVRPDVRTPGPTGNNPIKATSGNPDVVTFPNGQKVTFRYRLVDATDMQPSHDPVSFERNAAYPREVQGRAYHRDKSAQLHVTQGSQQLDADQLVRDTGNAEGPPIITSDGVLVAGNGRTMMIQRAARISPDAFDKYRAVLRTKAQGFGIDPALVDEFRTPVLVREIDDAAIDTRDVKALARLNDLSDMSQIKARDEASEGMARAKRLSEAPNALRFLRDTFSGIADDKKQTLAHILSDATTGRELLRVLTAEGIVSQAEQAKYFSGQYLTKDAKALIENMLYAGAIGDPDAYARARAGIPSILRKLDTSLPAVFEANANPAYSIATELRDALDVAKAMKVQKVTSAKDLKAQADAFAQDRSPMADVLAEVLVSDKKGHVYQLMARYAKLAGEHARMGEAADMFGYTPLGKEDLFYNVFHGERNALLDASSRDPMLGGNGGFFGMEPTQGQLFDNPIHPRETKPQETRAQREAKALKAIETGSEDLDVAQRGLDLGAEQMEPEHYIGDFYGRGDFDIYSIRRLDEYYFGKYAVGRRSGRKDLNAWLTEYPASTHVALIRRVPDGLWMMAPIGPGSLDELRAWGKTMARLEPGEQLPPILGAPHKRVEGYDQLGSEYKYDEGEGATQVGLVPPTTPQSSILPHAYQYQMGTNTKVENPVEGIRKLQRAMRFMQTNTGDPAGVWIGEGKLPRAMRKALGVYHTLGQFMRVKSIRNLDVTFHELGHHMHAMLIGRKPNGALDPAPLKPFLKELQTLSQGAVSKGKSGVMNEGWAEYWRLYMDNPDVLPNEAPLLHSWAQSQLRFKLPELEKYLDDLRKSWRTYKEASPHARFDAAISYKASQHWAIRDALRQLNADVLDEFQAVEQMEREITGELSFKPETPAALVRLTNGSAGIADTFINNHTLDFHTLKPNGRGLADILKPVKGEERDFSRYMLARRVKEVTERRRPIETGLRREDALQIIDDIERAHPEWVGVFDEMQSFNTRLLQYLVDADVMTPESMRYIQEINKNYVPLYRVQDLLPVGGPKTGKVLLNVPNPVKTLSGSGRDIVAPLESWVRNVYVYAHVAQRKQVEKAVAKLAHKPGAGPWLRIHAEPPLKKIRVRGEELEGWLKDQGIDFDDPDLIDVLNNQGVDPEMLKLTFTDIFRPNVSRTDNLLVVRDGKKTSYIEVERELYDVLMGTHREYVNKITEYAAAPFARMLRAGATLAPEFTLRNPVRDILTAMTQSTSGFNPLDFLRGLHAQLFNDELFTAFKSSGAWRATVLSGDRDVMRQAVQELVGTGRTLKDVVRSPIDLLRLFSETMENATRIGEFGKALGVTKFGRLSPDMGKLASATKAELQEAALKSREVSVDFAVHGAKMANMRAMAAFWNATMQGYRQMYRSFRKNPVAFSMKAGAFITVPTVSLYLVNRENQDYWDVPQWQRDLFWLVPAGIDNETGKTRFVRVPKPFELGWMFGTLPEHIMQFAETRDPHELKRTLTSFVTSIGGGLLPVPTFLLPLGEAYLNKSFRFDRKIVPEGMTRLDPDRQVKAGTSEISRQLQRFLNLPVSPAKIDHVIFGWTGGLGRLTSEAVDLASGRQKFKPTGRGIGIGTPSEVPGIRGLVVADYAETSETLNRFYVELEKARRARATFEDLASSEPELLDKRIADRPGWEDLAASATDYEAVAEQIAEIRRAIGEVRRDETIDRDEKRRQINSLAYDMNVLAAEFVQRRTPASLGRR